MFIHEWLAIACIIGCLALLTIISRSASMPSVSTEDSHYLTPPTIEVTIDGAVAHPGKYQLKKNSILQDLLDKAQVLPLADLKRMRLKSKLRQGQMVYVGFQEMITVVLEGAVIHPGPQQFPKGARLIDLKDKALFLPEADLRLLEKKRKLKPDEVISVPLK